MNINKKSLSVNKSNLGLGNVSNLSPSDIALLMSTMAVRLIPEPPSEDGDWILTSRIVSGQLTYLWVSMTDTGIFT